MLQDEAASQDFRMPRKGIATGCVDHILLLGKIAATLVRLVSGDCRPRLPP
jgi:chemotaxis response regulator CheB